MSTQRSPGRAWLFPFARFAAAVGALAALASCSTINDLFEAQKKVEGEARSAVGGPSTCCVNKQFFECPDAAAGLQCLGEPIELSKCVDACPVSDNDCTLKCMGEHGPDTRQCTRAPARDGECPQG